MEVKDANLVIDEYVQRLSQATKDLIVLKAYCTEVLREYQELETRYAQVESRLKDYEEQSQLQKQ